MAEAVVLVTVPTEGAAVVTVFTEGVLVVTGTGAGEAVVIFSRILVSKQWKYEKEKKNCWTERQG